MPTNNEHWHIHVQCTRQKQRKYYVKNMRIEIEIGMFEGWLNCTDIPIRKVFCFITAAGRKFKSSKTRKMQNVLFAVPNWKIKNLKTKNEKAFSLFSKHGNQRKQKKTWKKTHKKLHSILFTHSIIQFEEKTEQKKHSCLNSSALACPNTEESEFQPPRGDVGKIKKPWLCLQLLQPSSRSKIPHAPWRMRSPPA